MRNCIHCGTALSRSTSSRDHVPSKLLLRQPYPDNLKTIRVCRSCNTRFSPAEEYLGAFLGLLLTVGDGVNPRHVLERMIDNNEQMQELFDRSLGLDATSAAPRVFVEPDQSLLDIALGKNARGLLHIECGHTQDFQVAKVLAVPLENIPETTRALILPPASAWHIVQNETFRYHVLQGPQPVVRAILCEYLYAETHFKMTRTPPSHAQL